ncbi:hypothetical protein QTV49_004335 [Vibrio vulnificus]|nr:hypothetical protein [Vibrio vulnificus]
MLNQELERKKMIERLESSNSNGRFKPYQGEFKELDFEQDWYCPHCLRQKLNLSLDRLTIFCKQFSCGYEYSNSEGRDSRNVVWPDNYKLPVTLKGAIENEISSMKDETNENAKKITQIRKRNQSINCKISELQKELEEIE